MNTMQFDFSDSTRCAGFRLASFEVYNWGTFHDRVWRIQPNSENALLTGDIGSGKSTLVDALTTLLVAPQKIAYNKAAGAETRERTLRSYVAGHYKSERGDAGFSAKPVALRDRGAYSVILGRFHAGDIGQCVSLAQVFWVREAQGQAERLYVIADRELSISEHFSGFGEEIRELRRRLRADGMEIHESFTSYGAAYRRRLGIADEQAMDLFHQTISMKSVGNLTDFVREHMLQAFEAEPRIRALVGHFDDLNRAHEAVLIAKDQIARLTPLIADCDAIALLTAETERLRKCREILRPWFASLKGELLQRRLATLDAEIERHERQIASLTTQRREANLKHDELRRAIAANGGDRIERIAHEIDRLALERTERESRCARYDVLAHELGLQAAVGEDHFIRNHSQLQRERETLDQSEERTQHERTEATIAERELLSKSTEIETELGSLRRRRSNVPKIMLDLRERLCTEIACEESVLPFVGELLAVRSEEHDWEGAAERLLHGFGISLLVPDALYAQVAEWVERTHLGGRLVYYRVRSGASRNNGTPRPLDTDSLVHKLAILPDSPFYSWLEWELVRRFDYICCDTLERFRREPRAITRAGQVKSSEERHEKDDRRHIADRSNYVLGWSNEAKIAALEKSIVDLGVRLAEAARRTAQLNVRIKEMQVRRDLVVQLVSFESFHDLEWRPIAIMIEKLERERRELTEASNVLRALEQQLQENDGQTKQLEAKLIERQREHSVAQSKHEQARTERSACETVLAATPLEAKQLYFPALEAMRSDALGEHALSVESCENREREMREWLQSKIDANDKRGLRLHGAIVQVMQEYRSRYPAQAQELDASLQAAQAYRQALEQLRGDDLPRFEARFKELLNENAIREIANFHAQLNCELRTTTDRIESINVSLREIDYNPGRYITLEAERSPDAEIRDFQRDLRACTEGTLTGSNDQEYAEAKFLQVKRIIERFHGREGTAEFDRRWTRKVTDVRNWQVFSASERWREDDREHEHYTDSGGKSGGQKEKLAYTVLAAGIAYQFGLERRSSRSFRLVVIDEAFGRGSDESARYGLELFRRLHLQLLVVTPLQKIHVIEPFVAAVAFVHNDGRESNVHNLSIEEFRAQRAARTG